MSAAIRYLGIATGKAEAIKAVSKQLEELEKFNSIKADGKLAMKVPRRALVSGVFDRLQDQGISPRSFQGYNASLRSFMKYLDENDIILLNVEQENLKI